MRRRTYNWLDKQKQVRDYYKQLQKDNEVTQITVTNHTNDIRKVCLWGANSCVPLTDPLTLEGSFTKKVLVEKHPQGIVYSAVNDAFYCINQLADSVSVISSKGDLITTIDLYETGEGSEGGNGPFLLRAITPIITPKNRLPGTISPSSITINSDPESIEFGTVAVACSVSNEVVFIATDNTIVSRRDTGNRPLSIVFNPVDGCYYTANIASGTISKICALRRVNNLPRIEGAKTLGVNTNNGDLFVHNNFDGRINVYDVNGNFKSSVGATDEKDVWFAFNPETGIMFISFYEGESLLLYDSSIPKTVAKIPLRKSPSTMAYNPHTKLMYVSCTADQTVVRINEKNTIEDVIKLAGLTSDIAISTKEDVTAVSDTDKDTVTIQGNQSGPTVTVNDEYYEYREDFQHNPTLISHLKIDASGNDLINALQLIEKSAMGKETCQTLSLSNYQSPQNFSNISEVFDIDGDIIDGHSIWCFKINPKQVVTFLIYHKQFEMYSVLPEKSRVSTGVQMSKGIPASWREYNENEPPDESTF